MQILRMSWIQEVVTLKMSWISNWQKMKKTNQKPHPQRHDIDSWFELWKVCMPLQSQASCKIKENRNITGIKITTPAPGLLASWPPVLLASWPPALGLLILVSCSWSPASGLLASWPLSVYLLSFDDALVGGSSFITGTCVQTQQIHFTISTKI